MADKKLWPYSKLKALLSVPIILILFSVVFSLTQTYANWPPEDNRNLLFMVAVIISFLPLAMVLLDYFLAPSGGERFIRIFCVIS